MLVRCGDCSVDLELVWVELVTVHTDWCWAGGWVDGCQIYGDCRDVQNMRNMGRLNIR